jgi:hypothetical protein
MFNCMGESLFKVVHHQASGSDFDYVNTNYDYNYANTNVSSHLCLFY